MGVQVPPRPQHTGFPTEPVRFDDITRRQVVSRRAVGERGGRGRAGEPAPSTLGVRHQWSRARRATALTCPSTHSLPVGRPGSYPRRPLCAGPSRVAATVGHHRSRRASRVERRGVRRAFHRECRRRYRRHDCLRRDGRRGSDPDQTASQTMQVGEGASGRTLLVSSRPRFAVAASAKACPLAAIGCW
jgi:hypothetical protein